MSGVFALLWQAALLLLGAYFLGTFIGCWLRRSFNAPPKVAMEAGGDAALAQPSAAVSAPASERFGRALDGTEQIAQPVASGSPTSPPQSALPSAPPPLRAPATAPPSVADNIAVQTPEVLPSRPETPLENEPAKSFTPPMSAAAAAAAALAARQAAASEPAAAVALPAQDAEPIDVEPASLLPHQPAPATPGSVAAKMEALPPQLPPDIPDLPASSGSAGQAIVAAQIQPVDAALPNEPDDLTLIEGVTNRDAAKLREAGVTTFAAIAEWSAADVKQFSADAAGDRRIARENWIEQAQLLRSGVGTAYSRRTIADLVPRPIPSATDVAPSGRDALPPAPESHQGAPPDVSNRAAFARERLGFADDLQQVDGINAEVEKLLNEQGVTRIAQIAEWTVPEQKRIDRLLGGMDRVKRENWVGQAQRIGGLSVPEARDGSPKLASGERNAEVQAQSDPIGATTSSDEELLAGDGGEAHLLEPSDNVLPLPEASTSARDAVRGLRSVRSEAFVGSHSADDSAVGDDLKRIRGIGVLIEKRLRAMGYNSYQQIGSWTRSDVDRVNQQLDFRGRIERENWIEQARILASGGQTEFSRRQERSDE